MKHSLCLGLLLFGASIGCAHTLPPAELGDTHALYARGVEELYAGMHPEAARDFADIKTKHPYSHFAALAELRLADVHMRQNKNIEAVEAYRSFLRFHPSHDQAPYAALQVAEAQFAQIPQDWFFLPPGAEKDQTTTHAAMAAYQDFLSRFPGGASASLAEKRLNACRRRLADHELYVARFYLKRGQFPAAAARAEQVLTQFEGLGLDAPALWVAGRARLRDGDTAQAQRHLETLVNHFEETTEGLQAKPILQSLTFVAAADEQ